MLDGQTILLVDDQAFIVQGQKRDLESCGCRVLTAYSPDKAVEVFDAHPEIRLVLMDIDLGPDCIDGTQLAEYLLGQRELPIIFVSSHTEPEVVERTEKVSSYGYVVKGSGKTVLITAVKMALRLFDARRLQADSIRQLTHSRELLNYIIEHSRSAVAVHDRDLNYIFVSQKYLEAFRVREDNVIGRHHYEVFPDIPQKWRDVHARALAGEVISAEDDPFERADGSIDYTTWECRPWYDHDGSVGGIILYTEVVNEKRRQQLQLQESEENLRITLNSIGDAVIATDTEGRVTRMNPVAERLCGWPLAHARGRPLPEVFHICSSRTRRRSENPVQRVLDSGRIVGLANHTVLLAADGSEYQIADSAAPIRDRSGAMHGVVLVFRDVTEEYAANAERARLLRDKEMLLRDKEMLLKESHHRIKNNMTTVYNLLLLQAGEQENSDTRDVLQSAAGRVHSMMLLYNKLYRSEDYHEVAFHEFLHPLVDEIIQQFSGAASIRVHVHVDHLHLDARTAAAIGIIVNELITNSVKHAFRPHEQGTIRIALTCQDGEVFLRYHDDGPGIPEEVRAGYHNPAGCAEPADATEVPNAAEPADLSRGFGLELIVLQAEQCGGSLHIENEDAGSRFTIRFPAAQ